MLVASYQRDRGASANLKNASAYYKALDAASAPPMTFSPYRFGAKPVKFDFDLSFDYLPRAYLRPGPLLQLYRLKGCTG